MKKIKVINIILTILFSVSFIVMSFFIFQKSYFRLVETFKDLWISIKVYFLEIFDIENDIVVTSNEYSKIFTWDSYLPDNIESLKEFFKRYFEAFFNGENFKQWFQEFCIKMSNFSKIIVLVLPLVIMLFVLVKKMYFKQNNDYDKDSKPLKFYKSKVRIVLMAIKWFIQQYVDFLKEKSVVVKLWLINWALNLNVASIIVAFIGYYFYFAAAFNFGSIIKQCCKLIIDLQVLITKVPLVFYIVFGYILFDKIRQKMARKVLRNYENRNRGFINDLPIVSMSCGSMGKKKTTMITDMALSQEVMFRQEAFNRMQVQDMKFQHFPWILFERDIKNCMKYKTIFNLASIKKWIAKKRKRFNLGSTKQLYSYDYEKYGLTYFNGLKTENIFDVLSTYAQLYFIYVIESSLLVSNYSIREDNVLETEGNFPLWNDDFFSSNEIRESHHAHILDFDVLRLGKKLIEDNEKNGSFEFGIVSITEIGKERGNNLELKEIKKENDNTNQKNDLFNSWLKMCRHSATVDNYPFIKVFTDEQRPASWGADARDLCDIVNIVTTNKNAIAMPFYTIEEMIIEWIFNKFINFYYQIRYMRGDNTLFVYLFKQLASTLFKRNIRLYNLYGYSVLVVEKERGTQDGMREKKKYYLANQKIYNSRFTTDCFSDYFNDIAIKTKLGIMDYVEYETEKASIRELKMQNSYFINSLYKDNDS